MRSKDAGVILGNECPSALPLHAAEGTGLLIPGLLKAKSKRGELIASFDSFYATKGMHGRFLPDLALFRIEPERFPASAAPIPSCESLSMSDPGWRQLWLST